MMKRKRGSALLIINGDMSTGVTCANKKKSRKKHFDVY